jgi:hypothetical protein
MSLFDNGLKGNLITGLAVGIGATIISPSVITGLSRAIKPMAKAAIKGGLMFYEKMMETFVSEKKAAPVSAEKKTGLVVKPKLKTVTSKVNAVDKAAQTVMLAGKIKGGSRETVISIDEKTRITMGKKKKGLADVKEGDKVLIKYKEIEGKNAAKSLAIMPVKEVIKVKKKTN